MAKRKKISSPKRKKNTIGASPSVSDSKKKMKKLEVKEEEKEVEINMMEEEEVEELEEVEEAVMELVEKADSAVKVSNDDDGGDSGDEVEARFVGEPVPEDEARRRWPKRYQGKAAKSKQVVGMKTSNDNDETIQARCHYMKAEVDGRIIYNLYDDAHVKAGEGEADYICKIVEMFEAVDGTLHFTAQWYYRARDTVIKNHADLIDNKRVFFSEVQDDNPLDCLVERLSIARVPLNVDLDVTKNSIPKCDYYCDMLYLLPYSTFVKLPPDNKHPSSETSSTISSEIDTNRVELEEVSQVQEHHKPEVTLLDLYSGCGAMSTGLCLGANLSGLNLVTRWAVDLNKYACESLKLNHPETQVRNESAEDFLSLLKEWKKLCIYFSVVRSDDTAQEYVDLFTTNDDDGDDGSGGENDESDGEEGEVFEVQNIIAICYGDPNKSKEHGRGLYLKVRWKGYEADADSWEPIRELGNCREAIKDFVTHGFKSRILPLPGDVDVICGGPPCQGISGFNRFRNTDNPLDDEKNKQLIVFMDLVQYLKPKFVLMENVVDIVKFANGFLGRYALGRLIGMNYQVRMGMMAAGAYGLPQFRMRVFLWGALPTEKLPQYALPTHDVIVRGVAPLEFEMNIVAYNEGHNTELEEKLLLKDAISDLPAVENNENRDEMPYDKPAQTEFQRNIRLTKDELMGSSMPKPSRLMLYDHFPLELNKDDYDRVCRVPKRKGANFRDFPGVHVGLGNKVEWDPNVERVYLASGKPLVPDYAMSFVNGTSSKPFARLWWDETVPTVVTRAEPHNQAILHPEQDRVLSIRENARLQGFPDYYQLCGPVKERYIQVGNAVAVPVARALGYALGSSFGLACQGSCVDEPLFRLPPRFPNILERYSSAASEDDA